MASLFAHTSLPLWVWIVIIVVGAFVVLGTVAFILRLLIIRQRKADFLETFGNDDLPQRKVTVRRGRVVEHSRYLSLTGSKFGLNMFGPDDNDASSRAGARSKSPFEWWSTVKDRSQSRNSQVTQMSTTNDTYSIQGMPASPIHPNFYQRRDLNISNTSLTSTSKGNSVAVSVTETTTTTAPTIVSPPIVRNFSRSFSRPGLHSKYSPRQQQTLSRIEESSPHTSMISTRQSRMASLVSNNKRDTKSSTQSSVDNSPALGSLPQPSRWSDASVSAIGPIGHESQSQVTEGITPPPRVLQSISSSSLGEPESRSLHASQRSNQANTTSSAHQHSSSITALPVQTDPKQSNTYWSTRTDLKPVRSNSKKGNVLRKKSLKKAEPRTSIHL